MSILRHGRVPILLLLLLAGRSPAAQSLPGDPRLGERLAERWCVACHQVEPGDRTEAMVEAPRTADAQGEPMLVEVPAFQAVADDPAVTEAALRVFLQTSHAVMPNVRLTPDQMDDVIAYILGMKGR